MVDRKSWDIKVTREIKNDMPKYSAHCGVRGCSAQRIGGEPTLVFDFMKGHMVASHLPKQGQKRRDAKSVYPGDEFRFVKRY